MNFYVVRFVGSDEVIHHGNVAPQLHRDSLTRAYSERSIRFRLGTHLVGGIEPIEYTSQVLFPRLNIFSRVLEIRNLQLALMRVEVAKKSEPMQSCTMLVLSTVRLSQKNVWPRRLHAAKSDEDSVWKELVSPMAMRSAQPTSGTTEMLALKLKWMGSETNS